MQSAGDMDIIDPFHERPRLVPRDEEIRDWQFLKSHRLGQWPDLGNDKVNWTTRTKVATSSL